MQLSEELERWHTVRRLGEVGERARYLLALQVEEHFSRLIRGAQVLLFGSVAAGLATRNADIDLSLRLAGTDTHDTPLSGPHPLFDSLIPP